MIRRLTAPALIALTGLLTACAGPVRVPLAGQGDGGVSGLVTVEPIEGGQHLVTVSASDLPPPARLDPDMRTYVVWIQASEDEAPVRVGELIYEPEYREGRLHAETPLERFQLEITAERSGDAATPSDHVIVTQWVDEG
ncbi:MAG: hypothetical protein JJ863_24025 [Deltaproteobacteria bacterium]|nr:hypothetical protein [Deltaproteobacteria bacterium]